MAFDRNTRNRVKIAYVCSTLARKGPVFQLYNLVKHLDRSRFEPIILTLSPEPSNTLLTSFQKLDVPCYSLGLSRLEGIFLCATRLKKFMRDHLVDIVHTSGVRADIYSGMALTGIQRISTRRIGFFTRGLFTSLEDLIVMVTLKRFHQLVCVSDGVRQTLPRKQRLVAKVIYNGVNDETFTPSFSGERDQLRKRLALPSKGLIFVSVGGLCARKDPITVMKGFLCSKAAKEGTLVFLGDGPLRRKCARVAACRNNVLIAGAVTNVADYLRAADVFVSGALAEGLPNTVIEALACALPVVVSDIGPHREILALDARAGKLFQTEDVSALVRTLDQVVSADRELMQKAALSIVRNHLNAHRMSTQYQALYTDCCKQYKDS